MCIRDRFLAVLALAVPLAQSAGMMGHTMLRSERPPAIDCGEGKVANVQNICIEPEYIEGCAAYKSSDSCDSCD